MSENTGPAGAIYVGEWHDNYVCGGFRRFEGTPRGTAVQADGTTVNVNITGDQYADGAIDRYIVVNGDIHLQTAAAARQLATDLLAAADEMDSLSD